MSRHTAGTYIAVVDGHGPHGPRDLSIGLIRVHPETGEYWDSPSGAVMYLYGYAKAVLTGRTPAEMGETAKVNLR